jgi:phosphatidylethanolamine-binding protein (PEBP) family uncharacterized protein
MYPIETLLQPLGRRLHDRRPGDAHSLANAPEVATPNRLTLASPAFPDGGTIPAEHCGWLIGTNRSPALTWSPLPNGTEDLVLLLEDLDAPRATPAVHTVAAFAPAGDGIPEGALADRAPGVRFLRRGPMRGRYMGPRPLPGHGPHRYRFHLYALDRPVELGTVRRPADLPAALAGHVLASGMLTGSRES